MTLPPSIAGIGPGTPPHEAGRLIGGHVAAAKTRLSAKSGQGGRFAEGLAAATDEAVAALSPLAGGPVAICATGGYGRGRLAPFSDVDLLLLTPKGGAAAAEPLLYALFDSGFLVSQAVHDPASAHAAAAADLTCRTAFLDARLVAGDAALFGDFQERFDKLRRTTAAEFVRAKLDERDERHAAQGASRYAIEPDVKEGKGGLRDLDLLHWLDRYTDGISAQPTQRVRTPGLFSAEEAVRLRQCQDFLWAVRSQLHALKGRADERLSFDLQPRLARELGYRARARAPAQERLMKHYFLNATEIGRLTGAACATLEERALKSGPRLFAFGPKERAFDGAANVVVAGERLAFADPDKASVEQLFGLFLASGRSGLKLHPRTLKTAARLARTVRRAHRLDPGLAATFLAILRETSDLERILRRMNECGLLGRYLPAFGRIVGKAEYGLFRRFTLDEHVLRSVGVLARLRAGEGGSEFPVTQPIAQRLDPAVVALALLLQETLAGLPPRAGTRVARTVRAQVARLMPDAVDDVVFAVVNKDLLARTAQRRAVTELTAVKDVADAVETKDRLDLLALVTACRHRTAGVGSWRAYRNRDARLLVEEVSAFLSGGEAALTAYSRDRSLRLRAETAALSGLSASELDRFFARAGDDLWSMASPAAAAALAEAAQSVTDDQPAAAKVSMQPDGTARIVVCAPDRLGLFGDIAGAVTEAGGTVWGASAFSLADPDNAVVVIEMMGPGTPPEPAELSASEAAALQDRIAAVAAGRGPAPVIPNARLTDRRSVFDVAPKVRAYADVSEDSLVVEAEGLDRPGLLHLLAEEIEDAGASIRRAYVSTYGERAVDTFYLQDASGRKIGDPDLIGELRGRLLAVLRTA